MSARVVRRLLAVLSLGAAFVVGPQWVNADGVGNAQQAMQQAQDELDALVNQMGQLDEDYGAAQDRQTKVNADIAASQAKVDAMAAKLGDVQSALQDIAVAKFTTGGTAALSPLFSNAETFLEAEQRAALGRVALDSGEATADDLQSLLDDLNAAQQVLQAQQKEAADLVAALTAKQAQFEQLQGQYEARLAKAQADFGAAQVQAEFDRRAALANAGTGAPAPSAFTGGGNGGGGNGNGGGGNGGGTPAPGTTSPGRGGGGDNAGGGANGGTNGGSNDTPAPAPKPVVPPVSGKAGVAVAAAYSAIGTPYHFAGETPGVAFDCSGLTKWAWGRAGVSLPHQSGGQYASVPHVPRDQVQPGDLVFYYSPIGHVGIYVGGGMMIHAQNTGTTVTLAVVHWNKVVGVGRPG
jgi:cell wall-associated NlpC family hydrolase